jgi:hypothetical protein
MMRSLILLAIGAGLLISAPARASETAAFALIIGVNRGADRELPPLRYADDDAARYQELFRLLGMRTELLARIDQNTRRLHAQAAAEAVPPRAAELERAVTRLAREIQRAKKRGIRTAFYLVFAGHGNVKRGDAYILLEDDRLNGKRLADLAARVGAHQTHLIIDACHSGLLAQSRGPGGKRRALTGFSRMGALMADQRIGLLLSTSSGRESHEWEAFQAGVFSHEVRSGLYGAADADRDGFVSYREIAAFVERANAAIPNERFRPDVYARAGSGSRNLLDVRRALERRIEVRAERGAHYVLESGLGVRLADFHPTADHEMRIARPASGRLYLKRVGPPAREFEIPTGSEVVRLAELDAAAPRVAMRGAAHESFNLLFSAPFDESVVRGYRFRPLAVQDPTADDPERPHEAAWRRPATTIAFGLGAAALTTGALLTLSAYTLHSDEQAGLSQKSIAEQNQRVRDRQVASYVAFGVGGAALTAGFALLLWPDGEAAPAFSASAGTDRLGMSYGFSY